MNRLLCLLNLDKISRVPLKIGFLLFLIFFSLRYEVEAVVFSSIMRSFNNSFILMDAKTKDAVLFKDVSDEELVEKLLNTDRLNNNREYYGVLDGENTKSRAFESALNMSFFIIISFLINIPFFIRWAKQQVGTKEVLFYNVEGKFTYLAIILWIDQIEELYLKPMVKERKKIEKLYNIAFNGGQSIKIYKRKIHDILLIKAFGKNMVRTAFKRMNSYSKVVFIWDWAIYFSIIYSAICFFNIESSWTSAVLSGVLAGNIVAAPLWLICHLLFNHSLKKASRKAIKKGEGVGMRIIMAQFYGAFGGVIWKDLYYIQGRSSWTVASFGQNNATGQGDAGYSTAWTREQSKKDLDFDEKKD